MCGLDEDRQNLLLGSMNQNKMLRVEAVYQEASVPT